MMAVTATYSSTSLLSSLSCLSVRPGPCDKELLEFAPCLARHKRRHGLIHSSSAAPEGNPEKNQFVSRRAAAARFAALLATAASYPPSPASATSLPASTEKTKNLSIEEIKKIIERDIQDGQYFVTGNLTRKIYRDDCRFKDPTNTTVGLDKYLQAVSILFDPAFSKQELVSIAVTSPTTIDAKWTLGGFLKFPWRPRVVPFEGATQYTIDAEGLVSLHDESWSISPLTALIETITPTFGST